MQKTAIIGETEARPDPEPEQTPAPETPQAEEFGGRKGPDPTRYGDWEKNGRCIDF